MLKLSGGVHAGYGRTEVIHGVDIEVPTDGVVAVMGHNGAGKTTLLRAAVGLVKTTKGSITFDGVDITKARPSTRIKNGIATSRRTAEFRPPHHRGEPAGGGRRP